MDLVIGDLGESVDQPLAYYDNNVGKTARLLTGMKEKGVFRFVKELDAHSPLGGFACERLMLKFVVDIL